MGPAADQVALAQVLSADPPAFALIYRPDRDPSSVEVFTGEQVTYAGLSSLDALPAGPTSDDTRLLLAIPFRQAAERGFQCHDDGVPLVGLSVRHYSRLALEPLLALLPDVGFRCARPRFDDSDEAFAATVRDAVSNEIGSGEGSNFVIRRSLETAIPRYRRAHLLSIFRRLLLAERGTYWTFLISAGGTALVGATPESHVTLHAGLARLNPISGTLGYGPAGPDLGAIDRFLADKKERGELQMVLDEELKMLAALCPNAPRVLGPKLKQMARLAHVEYLVEGTTTADWREVLAATLFAPTVVGSPLENAFRVIRRVEQHGRGYYAGVVALVSESSHGRTELDSAITIRTAEVNETGKVRMGVGVTVVHDSIPSDEVRETVAKSAGMAQALGWPSATAQRVGPRVLTSIALEHEPSVIAALASRNETLNDFWFGRFSTRSISDAPFAGRSAIVVDAEDRFTAMLVHMLTALGLIVQVASWRDRFALEPNGVVIIGPGPGDPRDRGSGRVARLGSLAASLLRVRHPFVGICLGHQLTCLKLGLPLIRLSAPNQGVQAPIDLFGRPALVGFYNTHVAVWDRSTPASGTLSVAYDEKSRVVHALRGPHFATTQFHPESVLTQGGLAILRATISSALCAQTSR